MNACTMVAKTVGVIHLLMALSHISQTGAWSLVCSYPHFIVSIGFSRHL